jgi:hypothetical protein
MSMRCRFGSVSLVLAVLVLFAVACAPTADTSTGDGGTTTSCDQQCLDSNVGLAIVGLVSNLYNQVIAGKPTGVQTATANCPLGGTAVITGSDSVDTSHDLTDVNLQYAMTGCEVLENGDTLTFSGTISEQGSFDSASLETVNFASTGLEYSGTVGSVNVSGPSSCAVHVNEDSNASVKVTGTMCGRTF